MKDLPKNYLKLFTPIMSYVGNLVNLAINDNKKIIIWGYGRGGRWLHYLIENYDGRIKVDYIIDNGLPSFISSPRIYRSSLLAYLQPEGYIVLSTIKNFDSIAKSLRAYGYEEESNAFDIYTKIGDSYLTFLQKNFNGVRFNCVTASDSAIYCGDNNEHIPFGYSCADVVFEEIKNLGCERRFFDFGCGQGAAVMLAWAYGVDVCPGGGGHKPAID